MFQSDSLKFYKELKKNNNREWYQRNKERYQKSLIEPAREIARELNDSKKFPLKISEKNPLFRIHRDTRFSHDKSPLKTHGGMIASRSGDRNDWGIIYLHIEPGELFLAAGFWHPDPALLTQFRLKVAQDQKGTRALLQKLKKGKLRLESDETLKRLPRGFELIEDQELQELLKMKNWVVTEKLNEKTFLGKSLAKSIEDFSRRATPLLDWGWKIVDLWRKQGGDPMWQERER